MRQTIENNESNYQQKSSSLQSKLQLVQQQRDQLESDLKVKRNEMNQIRSELIEKNATIEKMGDDISKILTREKLLNQSLERKQKYVC